MSSNGSKTEAGDHFEDRYIKLKNVAIRLKKQLSEQKEAMAIIEEDNKKLNSERDNQKSKYSNAQILQAEIDRIQDLLDIQTKDLKQRNSEILETAKQLSATKSQLTDSYQVNDSLLVTIKDLNKKTMTLEADIKKIQKTNKYLENKRSSDVDELSKLKKENSLIENDLTAEMNTLKKSYNQHYSSDLLEDEDKQLCLLLCQIEEKNITIASLRGEISDEKENLSALKEQVKLVNEKATMESTRAESLMVTVSELRKGISKLNDEMEPLLEENETQKILIESIKEELQNEKVKSIEANKSFSVSEEALIQNEQRAEIETKELEEIIIKQKEEAVQLQEQMSSMKLEFEAYKTRAQSVLKQKTAISVEEYSQLLFECQQLNVQMKAAENSLKQFKCELSSSKDEVLLLRSEKNSLSQMFKSAREEINNLKESFQKEIDLLKEKLKSESEDNREMGHTVAMHIEITNKFKLETESMKVHHAEETDSLKEKIKLLECSQTDVKTISRLNKGNTANEEEMNDIEEPKFDFSSMVREDGEGSECVEHPQVSHSRLYHPPSLEHLINRPLPAECHIDDDTASVNTEISFSEFNRMETKVSSLERSLHHLSNLLSESEAENLKLNQLCDVLKENIRSSSRREIREKHFENNEYIKNVLLKFLHLKTGNEKKRLVPVLQTILQLSLKETSSLMSLAAGDDLKDYASGWSSYIHLWSNN